MWVFLAVLKFFVLRVLNFNSVPVTVLYGFFSFVFAMACARRLGVINYLEAGFVAFTWVVGLFLADALILSPLYGPEVFGHKELWWGYALIALTIFFFHKKRHVQIRKEHAAHSAHH